MSAAGLLAQMLCTARGSVDLHGRGNDGKRYVLSTPAAEWELLARRIERVRGTDEPRLHAIPRLAPGDMFCGDSGVVWCEVTGTAQAEALERFRPVPTLTLQVGDTTRRMALWGLRKSLRPPECTKVNRHLSHKLGAAKKHADTDWMFWPPGTVLHTGRERPVPVKAVQMNVEGVYAIGEVCRSLPRSIPDPGAWFERNVRGVGAAR